MSGLEVCGLGSSLDAIAVSSALGGGVVVVLDWNGWNGCFYPKKPIAKLNVIINRSTTILGYQSILRLVDPLVHNAVSKHKHCCLTGTISPADQRSQHCDGDAAAIDGETHQLSG